MEITELNGGSQPAWACSDGTFIHDMASFVSAWLMRKLKALARLQLLIQIVYFYTYSEFESWPPAAGVEAG